MSRLRSFVSVKECHIVPAACLFQPVTTAALLPALSLNKDAIRITIVRDPVERLLSEYTFSHHMFGDSFRTPNVVAFANHSYRRNWQVAVVAGLRWSSAPAPVFLIAKQSHLDLILAAHMRGTVILGVFEQFDRSVAHILKKLSIPTHLHETTRQPITQTRKWSPRGSQMKELVPLSVRHRLRDHHSFDVALHREAMRSLEPYETS